MVGIAFQNKGNEYSILCTKTIYLITLFYRKYRAHFAQNARQFFDELFDRDASLRSA
jgi:hypothetical protein